MTTKRLLIYIFLILTMTLQLSGASIKVSIQPDRGKRQIEVGDRFYITIEVKDSREVPSAPELPGAKLLYFDKSGESSSFSSVNGVTTQTYSSVYSGTYRAEKAGSYTVPVIKAGSLRGNQPKYAIGSAMPAQSANTPNTTHDADDDSKPKYIGKGDGNLFLRATVSDNSPYEQQALTYTVKLYTTYDAIKFIGATASPKFDGFVVEESKDISNSLTFENYQGKTYATAVIAKYVIFPQMAGNLKVQGNTYTISVDSREYYHQPFFGTMSVSTPLQLNVTPNDLVVNVKSLPNPKPADFSGGVGKFKLTSSLKSSEFKTNQAAQIVYTLTGRGNLKYVQMPDLVSLYPQELEIYTPNTKNDVKLAGGNLTGSVTFDYSFMPLEEGEFKIPPVKLVYFNPETGKYESSVAEGYTISVGKGKEGSESARKRLKFDSDLQAINISEIAKTRVPRIYSFTYWLWFIIPVVILAVVFVWLQIYAGRHADVAALNARRADRIARKRLKKAEIAMRANKRDLFYDEILSALWGYIADKLKMPTSALMRDNIRQVLASKDVPEEIIQEFIGAIDNAEFAKYSSAEGNDMQTAYNEAARTINNIENAFKKKS
ncbi:MAG: BatD family protein [Muribaculaceae bacterium]|nr:BatD family protein [Muribaculaceae bacterium]